MTLHEHRAFSKSGQELASWAFCPEHWQAVGERGCAEDRGRKEHRTFELPPRSVREMCCVCEDDSRGRGNDDGVEYGEGGMKTIILLIICTLLVGCGEGIRIIGTSYTATVIEPAQKFHSGWSGLSCVAVIEVEKERRAVYHPFDLCAGLTEVGRQVHICHERTLLDGRVWQDLGWLVTTADAPCPMMPR
jgi:hypothetical protein